MKLTEEIEKDVIEILSSSQLSESTKIQFLRFIMNNNIELLLAEIKGRYEN